MRQVVTGLSELQRTGGQILVTSMCIGSGTPMFPRNLRGALAYIHFRDGCCRSLRE